MYAIITALLGLVMFIAPQGQGGGSLNTGTPCKMKAEKFVHGGVTNWTKTCAPNCYGYGCEFWTSGNGESCRCDGVVTLGCCDLYDDNGSLQTAGFCGGTCPPGDTCDADWEMVMRGTDYVWIVTPARSP